MYYACPKCEREFREGGFCPYDGSSLDAALGNTNPEPGASTDELATHPDIKSGTLAGSAVASVLKGVLQDRTTGSERAADSLLGAELDGRYRIEKLIGEGGMGMVYMAKHIVIEKKVAVKVLRAEVAADEAVAKRFVQEARAASRIGHPNIVDVTDFGTTKAGLTYQVMEYLEGQTLTELIASVNPLPLARILGIIAQICRALGAAHNKGIVHRDLKPDNIFLVTRDGRQDFVKIVDFGIAKVPPREDSNEARLTQVGTVFGTPEYMSPEQASGRGDVDLRADVYAVGTILYEMLVGNVPHKGETTVRTLAMQILDDPPPLRVARPDLEISEDLEKVVMRALQKDRDQRFQTTKELLDALEESTSKTELDLPLLLQQERISAEQAQQQNDTIPDVDLLDQDVTTSDSREITSIRDAERASRSTGSTRARRRSRVTDPVFLRRGSSASVPIFDPGESDEAPIRGEKSKVGRFLAVLLLVGGVASAFLLLRGEQHERVTSSTVDAGAIEQALPTDAAPVPHVADAAAEVSFDARPADMDDGAIDDRKLKQTRGHNALMDPSGKIPKPLLKGEALITVITRPRGARLSINGQYAGPGGTNIQRPIGDEETVKCRLSGYSEGSVKIKFDGKTEVYLCKMKKLRKKRCVEGVMNPFDDCPQ